MFQKSYYNRIKQWKDLRTTLETAQDPLQDCIDFWRGAPLGALAADPFDKRTWPDPWQMIDENIYCDFLQILAICYTLQLTDRFSQTQFEIHIKQDKKNSRTCYLLLAADRVIGFQGDKHVAQSDLPKQLISQQSYIMSPLQ
jgi:hypothetical protein